MKRSRRFIVYNKDTEVVFLANFDRPIREDCVLYMLGINKCLVYNYSCYDEFIDMSRKVRKRNQACPHA